MAQFAVVRYLDDMELLDVLVFESVSVAEEYVRLLDEGGSNMGAERVPLHSIEASKGSLASAVLDATFPEGTEVYVAPEDLTDDDGFRDEATILERVSETEFKVQCVEDDEEYVVDAKHLSRIHPIRTTSS
jgi:hypothetical protein